MYIIYKHNIYTHIHIYIYIYTHTMATMAGGICHGNFVSRLVLSINSARLDECAPMQLLSKNLSLK